MSSSLRDWLDRLERLQTLTGAFGDLDLNNDRIPGRKLRKFLVHLFLFDCVERVFQTYSPTVSSITVKRRGDVRRAKLYYLRGRTGKAARIKEKI